MFTLKGVTNTKQACCEALSVMGRHYTFMLERLFCIITLLTVKKIFHNHVSPAYEDSDYTVVITVIYPSIK